MHRHTHDMIMIRRKTKNATCCRKVMQSINFPFFLYGPRVHLWTLFASIDAKKGCSWWGLRHANRTSHPIPISLAVRATSAKATKTICIFAFKRIARKLIYKIFTSNLTRWTYPVRKMCTTFYEYQVVISMMCVFVCVFLSFLLPPCACVFVCCLRSYTLNEPRILFASLFQKPFTGAPVNKKPWATVLKVEKPPKHNK